MGASHDLAKSSIAILVVAATLASAVASPQTQAAPATVSLSAVAFASRFDGWVAGQAGHRGVVLATHNGGRHWMHFRVGFAADGLQFVDARHGWATALTPASCDPSGGPECRSVVEVTVDGGQSWHRSVGGGRCGEFSSLQMANAQIGWVVLTDNLCASHIADSGVLRTVDGGRTWHTVFQAPIQITGLHFGDRLRGWVVGGNPPDCNTVLFHTWNGGVSWQQSLRLQGRCGAAVDFVNPRVGWLLTVNLSECSMSGCYGYQLYRTTNGGKRWRVLQRGLRWRGSGPSGFFRAPTFATPQVGYIPIGAGAGSGRGGLIVTWDGGRHWTGERPKGRAVSEVAPVDGREAWAIACRAHATTCDRLLYSGNAGRSWSTVHLDIVQLNIHG